MSKSGVDRLCVDKLCVSKLCEQEGKRARGQESKRARENVKI